MYRIHRSIKPVTLAILSALLLPTAQAELENESWIVQSGDGLYSIARKLAPKDLKMQARIRNEITRLNPTLNPESLETGMSLKLPSFLFQNQQPTPAATPARSPEPAGRMQISTPAKATPDPQEVIGKVVIQSGSMVAENRGSTRQLNRTASILKGDTLKTADNARSQIRLKDGALIAVSPNTELKFEEFAYNGSEDGTERSILNLIKGGFRTITGAIGHTNKQNYQVKTSVATIGIRGTHYGLMLCEAGSCQNAPAGNLSDGLYGGVVDGSIVTDNGSGSTTFNNDQYFHIATALTSPVERLLPPPIFNDSPAPDDKSTAQKPNGTPPLDNMAMDGKRAFTGNPIMPINGEIDPRLPVQPILPGQNIPPPPPKDQQLPPLAPIGSGIAVSFTGTKLGLPDGGAGAVYITSNNPNRIALETITDANSNVIGNLPFAIYEEHDTLDPQTSVITHQTHNAVRLQPGGTDGADYDMPSLGGNGSYGVNWGRWHGNYVLQENGIPVVHDSDFHFIYSDRLTPKDTLFNLGGLRSRIDVYRMVGGTLPTDNLGNIASAFTDVEVSAAFDFVSQQMLHYSLSVNNFSLIDHVDWTVTTSGPLPFTALGDSFHLFGDTVNCPTCEGDASVMFVGNTADALMTSYAIYDTTNLYALSGVALLAPQSGAVNNGEALLVAASDTGNPTAFPVQVAPGSQDNIYIGTDFAGTNAPVAAIDHYIGTDTLSHYHSMSVNNPSLATAIVNSTITEPVLVTAGVNAYWGRWDNTATVSGDMTTLQDVTAHFIGSNSLTPPTQLGGLTGTFNYSIANGGTAYDANYMGTTATSVTAGMTADFTNQRISAYNVSVSGFTGVLQTGSSVPFTQLNQGFGLVESTTCSPCSSTGTATVQFVGLQAEGALTSFSLSNGTTTAAGVALLTQIP